MGSELSSVWGSFRDGRRRKGTLRETKKKWPERWQETSESRGKGVLRKRVWPAAENVAEKSGPSQVLWGDLGQEEPGVHPRG